VLLSLHARLRGVPDDVSFVPDAATLRRVEVLTLDTDAGRFDVLARPAGAGSYAELRRTAERYDVGGFTVRVASIGALIAMKRTAGRPKDLADIVELEAIERLRARGGAHQ
jgi:putative intracellular protease/amidase